MRPVYAAQFEVLPPPDFSQDTLPGLVRTEAGDWVSQWYAEHQGLSVSLPFDGGSIEPLSGHRVSVTAATPELGHELWELQWSRSSETHDGLLWTSHCVVAHAGGRTEASVVVHLESTVFRLSPLEFEVGRPRLVRRLIDTLPCRQGRDVLTTKPQTVGVSDIRAFIADHLLSPDRRLPVIVFSRDGWSEALLADPSAVADAAAGLARVVVLADKWSSFGVTNELGKSLSCFNGAVRIYWPGLTTTDDPYTHPLFLPDVLRDWQGDRRKLAHVIVRRLAPISAYRFVEGEIARSVRAAIQRRRTREEEAWREEIKSGRADKALLQEKMLASLDQLQAVQQKTRTLQSRLEEAELGALQRDEEVRSLREQNTALRSSFAQVATAAARERQAAPKEARIADVHREFKSVVAALSGAERDFASRLVIWPSAKRSAEKSRYARPNEVYQGLLAIREVLDQYFKSRTDGTSMGSWEEAFEHRGFKYAGKDSQTTTTMHGKHRKFTYQGRTLQMERHLTLGGGDRENCLQIYFEVDDKAKRGIVGYCGMHLPYAGMST